MSKTRFVESEDRTRIAYDVTGNGPALILLHGGLIQNREVWHELGYVDRLSKEYMVIAIDLRCHGESDRPSGPGSYAAEKFVSDIKAVADACCVRQFYLWGYSFGGTVGLQIASRVKETIGAILVGIVFGKVFTPEMVAAAVGRIESVEQARAEGLFQEMEMAPMERDLFARFKESETAVLKDFYRDSGDYPAVEPSELLCPALVVVGTANMPAYSNLCDRKAHICSAGIQTLILEEMDHGQELSEVDKVLPECLSFLRRLEQAK